MEVSNTTGVVTPQIKSGGLANGEKLINALSKIPEDLQIYQREYIPTSGAVKDYVDAHSGGGSTTYMHSLKLSSNDTGSNYFQS